MKIGKHYQKQLHHQKEMIPSVQTMVWGMEIFISEARKFVILFQTRFLVAFLA